MVLPLLLVLVGGILWIGRAGAARTQALSEARERSWAEGCAADPGEVLRLNHDPSTSLTESRSVQPFRGRESAMAVTGTHFRTWSHEDMPACESGDRPDAPGTNLLRRLVARNPDSLPFSDSLLPELDAARFIDPTRDPAVPR